MSKKSSKHPKTLIVVESPSKAKTISKYLGQDFIIRASYGHMIDLSSGGKNKIGVDIVNNFKPKYQIIPDKKDKLNSIIDAAGIVDNILLASDPDREGEAIAWHIAECLESTGKPIKRVLFHEITKSAILKAINNPIDLNKNLFDAQQARRVLDRIVGYMVSPYVISTLGPKLSAGRVQSVAVKLIVDRDKEIDEFKAEEYWNIAASLDKNSLGKSKFIAKLNQKVNDKLQAESIKKDLENCDYFVSKVEAEEKVKKPFPPFTTSKLQQAAAAKFKFAVNRTMKAAQSLYEDGFCTYIRTDSTRSSPESIEAAREWIKNQKYDVPSKYNIYKNNDAAQDAHEAIRPTDINLTPDQINTGDEDQNKLYKLIWERFVASQMKPAIYDTVNIIIKTSNDYILKASGKTLKYAGWLDLTSDADSKKDDDEGVQLPILSEKEKLFLVKPGILAEQKFTQPPSRFNEGSLVKELERRGIGRPSTFANIISKITDRNYVEKKKEMFVSTDLGKKIINLLDNKFDFINYEYTANMEIKLDKIAEGKLDYAQMMKDFYTPFESNLEKAKLSLFKETNHICEKCNSVMLLKHGKFGYYISCSNVKNCKNNKSVELNNDEIVIKTSWKNPVVDGILCPKCGSGMFKRDGKFGPFYSCSQYPSCSGTSKFLIDKNCEKCGCAFYATAFNEELKLACSGYPNCKNIKNLPSDIKIDWISPNKIYNKYSKKNSN